MLNPDGLDCHLFISILAESNLLEWFVCDDPPVFDANEVFWKVDGLFIFRKSLGRLKFCSIKQSFVQYCHDMQKQVRDSSTNGRGSNLVFTL